MKIEKEYFQIPTEEVFSKSFISELEAMKAGQQVNVAGWVHKLREHGQIIFVDIRDSTGLIQTIVDKELIEKAGNISRESVIEVRGILKRRPQEAINPKIPTGEIEIHAEELSLLGKADELPLDPTLRPPKDEELRLKYRYLDLRRERLQKNLRERHEFVLSIRNFLSQQGFIEVETPILSQSTPEGARDFLVPSRLKPGKFYALPQSPQQYKQLLMVAGVERYFQMARCFRDEDLRADRQLEFTQIDIELSFTTREGVFRLVEEMLTQVINKLFPEKKIALTPFPKLSYQEAMERYKSDKPDLRKDKKDDRFLHFCWVTDFPMYEYKKEEERWEAMHHPFTMPREEDLDLMKKGELDKVKAKSYDLVCNGIEVASGSIRIINPEIQRLVFSVMGLSDKEITEKFGHLIEAFKFGVPPHGGIALAVDRLSMIFRNEENIREVIAFPVTSSGQTSVMDAPCKVDEKQLKQLGIKLAKPKTR